MIALAAAPPALLFVSVNEGKRYGSVMTRVNNRRLNKGRV